ncbi:hypothetical protein [Streptomyces albidoflavus]|uniref:hypothetical protein n=1 Tax=Streptomyces albidoflavus TaxID=1886 RepID=UPI003322511A
MVAASICAQVGKEPGAGGGPSEVGADDQEQQHGGRREREAGGAAGELGGQRQVLVGEAGESGQDRAVEREQ